VAFSSLVALLLASCMGSTNAELPQASGGALPDTGGSPGASGSKSTGPAAAGSGGSGHAGSAGIPANAGEGGTSGMAGSAATSGGAGGVEPEPIDPTLVISTSGCGTEPTQALGEFVQYTIETSGEKEADSSDSIIDGPWTMTREYFVWLPPDYDPNHPYPLVIQGPGCGGTGVDVYSLSPSNGAVAGDEGVNGSVIRVGLTPPPASEFGHAEAPFQGCFDDKEGDDSLEWPFYEAVLDQLKAEVCYDENRVFASGNSSGAWLAEELGCKYAGTTDGYAIRAIAENSGGLPTDPAKVPACSNQPMAGFWIFEVNDGTHPFNLAKYAINRAMQFAGCTIGVGYDDTMFESYPIGNGMPDDTCKKILGCPVDYPLVVCAMSGTGHGGHEDVANPGFATFIESLAAP
jgi:polyhydroxybutyrate depolymerase